MFEDDSDNKRKDHSDTPLFKKAMEIFTLSREILDVVEKTDINLAQDKHEDYKRHMLANTMQYLGSNGSLICAKIAGAFNAQYDLQMENAALIRKACREIIADLRGLEIAGFEQAEYLDLLRNAVEEFRVLFAEWVATFDPFNYTIDRWGLFNPPGVNYDDHDPDDDIPFNPSDNRDFDDGDD